LNLPGCYKDVKDTTVVAQFEVIRDGKSDFLFSKAANVYILAWTTTPWTLPANTALTVGDKITYVQINTFNAYTHKPVSVVLAKDLVGRYFSDKHRDLKLADYKPGDKAIPYEIVGEFSGSELVGVRYHQLLPYATPANNPEQAFRVIAGDFVTTEDGTGVVHTAPTFGADDFRVAMQNGVPAMTVLDAEGNEIPVVDKKGKFISAVGEKIAAQVEQYNIRTHKPLGPDDFYVKNYTDEDESHPDYKPTDVIISIILKEENKAFKVEKYEHPYPHCWRTDKPVLYYPLDSWFIRTTALKDKMVEVNKTIHWKPESTGTGRFGNWLENLVDWNLSRSRYWGTPLPIWRTRDGKEERCIGSLSELKEEIERSITKGHMTSSPLDHGDLHRPYVDEIILTSPSGEPMYREPDLIDVWFDSGAMPYAQWHYPFENKDIFEKNYPADFIAEGVDQTRGWFFTLHAIAVLINDSSEEIQEVNRKNNNPGLAFRNVISNGLVLDKNGNKMSKRLGNVVNPFDALAKYGPDLVRWYMIENAPPWDNLKFDFSGIVEVQRRFFGTLLNTYSFFAMYANIDGFVMDEMNNVDSRHKTSLDRWITSKLQSLIIEVTRAYDDYEPTRAARAIQEFVNDHLSNWYVRLNRKRFWKPSAENQQPGTLSDDKKAAYETLYECLMVTAQLMSPIAPFFSEWLYRNLTDNVRDRAVANKTPLRHPSIHLTDLTQAEEGRIDKNLEQSMDYAQRICSLVHSIRKNSKIKVRTPLQKILLPVIDRTFIERIRPVEDIIMAEVNVKAVEYVDDTSGILVKKVKPNFAKLGKQYGPRMKEVTAVIGGFDQNDIATLEKTGTLQKGEFTLTPEDVIITSEDIPGWSVASDNNVTVALDVNITDELRKEGVARDFVNRIQNLRKDLGLEVLDKINIEVEANGDVLVSAIDTHKEYIQTETQALRLELKNTISEAQEIDMDEVNARVKITVNR